MDGRSPDPARREAYAIRRLASSLLERLVTHRRHSEDRLARLGRPDPLKAVTGRSAIDDAIAATVDIIRRVDDQLVEPAPAPEVVVPHSAAAPVRQAEPRHHHAASSSRS